MMKPFEGLLGNNCELRMIEYLLPLEGIEFNISQLAEEVGISRVSATRLVQKFVEWGVLKSIVNGRVVQYSLNFDSPIVRNIQQLNNLLIERILGDEALYEIHDYLEEKRPSHRYSRNPVSSAVSFNSNLSRPSFVEDVEPPKPWFSNSSDLCSRGDGSNYGVVA